MSISPPQVQAGAPQGTVCISVEVAGPPDVVWLKLTQRNDVAFWFGNLSDDLKPGVEIRLDFGDGDFFTIANVRLHAPHDIEYEWRFLGTGPSNRITWRIEDTLVGASVTVNDAEPLRSKATVDELTEGWTDFLRRLQDHMATGLVTRYDWRRDFEGAVDLESPPELAAQRLLGPAADRSWMPFGSSEIADAARVRLDTTSPDYVISRVGRKHLDRLTFTIGSDTWQGTTCCELAVKPRGQGSLLTVHHKGWDDISNNPSVCMVSRRLFAEAWIEALNRARLVPNRNR